MIVLDDDSNEGASLESDGNFKKQIANMVVKYLTPHYKKGKVASRVKYNISLHSSHD